MGFCVAVIMELIPSGNKKKWWCKFFFSSTKWWEAEKEIVDQYKKRKPSEVATRGVPWKRCS